MWDTRHDFFEDKIASLVKEIQEAMDEDREGFSLFQWLADKAVSTVYCKGIRAKLEPVLWELFGAYEDRDPQLLEAYSHLGKPGLKLLIRQYSEILIDLERYQGEKRVHREHRDLTPEEMRAAFEFQEEDRNLRVVSVCPLEIMGSRQVWLYNTSARTLTVLRSNGKAAMSIHRSSVTNFDSTRSVTKSITNVKEVLHKVLNDDEEGLDGLMDGLKTLDRKPQFRGTENVLILRVIK